MKIQIPSFVCLIVLHNKKDIIMKKWIVVYRKNKSSHEVPYFRTARNKWSLFEDAALIHTSWSEAVDCAMKARKAANTNNVVVEEIR